MANTFVKIATVTVGSGGSATMDFTSIPATYTDLCLKVSARTDRTPATSDGLLVTFNNTSTSYSDRYLQGAGSGTPTSGISPFGTTRLYAGELDTAGATASTFASFDIYIPNYASSNSKSVSTDSTMETNATTAYATLTAGLWSNSAAITSIKFAFANSTNFVQYSSATLYGIRNS